MMPPRRSRELMASFLFLLAISLQCSKGQPGVRGDGRGPAVSRHGKPVVSRRAPRASLTPSFHSIPWAGLDAPGEAGRETNLAQFAGNSQAGADSFHAPPPALDPA